MKECLDLVQKRAYFPAGAAVIPVPFLDVVIDVGILSQLIPEINARFGLTQSKSVSTTQKPSKYIGQNCVNVAWFSGLVVARTAVKKSLNNMAAKYIANKSPNSFPLVDK